MKLRRSGLLLASLVMGLIPPFGTEAVGIEVGFHHCAPPFRPSCMGQNQTFETREAIAACEPKVRTFTNTLALYRTCLLQQSQRAVVDGNDAISDFRCRVGQRERCR